MIATVDHVGWQCAVCHVLFVAGQVMNGYGVASAPTGMAVVYAHPACVPGTPFCPAGDQKTAATLAALLPSAAVQRSTEEWPWPAVDEEGNPMPEETAEAPKEREPEPVNVMAPPVG